ncbi:MAG TPA: hypothetical protein VKZ49_15145 [Polyangiaceae bacterium]|nr:hypothetical protein [Polyangiaceae bacterium]
MPGDPDVNPASERSVHPEPPVVRAEHDEDSFTRVLEQQAAKIPSQYFLSAAILAMLGSVAYEIAGRRRVSRFIGMWPAPLLVMGVYNKLVKVLGSR